MDARIKSGHDECVSWSEVALRTDTRFKFQTANSKYTSATSQRNAPESCMNLSPKKTEGVGNAGCPLHPQPRVYW
jgi:hypothetical protein